MQNRAARKTGSGVPPVRPARSRFAGDDDPRMPPNWPAGASRSSPRTSHRNAGEGRGGHVHAVRGPARLPITYLVKYFNRSATSGRSTKDPQDGHLQGLQPAEEPGASGQFDVVFCAMLIYFDQPRTAVLQNVAQQMPGRDPLSGRRQNRPARTRQVPADPGLSGHVYAGRRRAGAGRRGIAAGGCPSFTILLSPGGSAGRAAGPPADVLGRTRKGPGAFGVGWRGADGPGPVRGRAGRAVGARGPGRASGTAQAASSLGSGCSLGSGSQDVAASPDRRDVVLALGSLLQLFRSLQTKTSMILASGSSFRRRDG